MSRPEEKGQKIEENKRNRKHLHPHPFDPLQTPHHNLIIIINHHPSTSRHTPPPKARMTQSDLATTHATLSRKRRGTKRRMEEIEGDKRNLGRVP